MERNGFYVDGITNSIIEIASGKCMDTDVRLMVSDDIRNVLKRDGWRFNWRQEWQYPDRQLYKLVIFNDHIIQGLISLQLS